METVREEREWSMRTFEKDLIELLLDQGRGHVAETQIASLKRMMPQFRDSVLTEMDISMKLQTAEGKEYLVAYNQDGDLKINLVKSPERQNEDAALYVAEDERDECIDARLRKVILSILSDIKFSLKASGTTYLVDGVIMALSLKNESHRLGMTKEIYPYIADIYGVSVNSVERNIRMAIETAWSRMSYDYATKHYPYEYTSSLGRPTNQEFLFAIAGVIRRSYPEYAAWCRRMANRM